MLGFLVVGPGIFVASLHIVEGLIIIRNRTGLGTIDALPDLACRRQLSNACYQINHVTRLYFIRKWRWCHRSKTCKLRKNHLDWSKCLSQVTVSVFLKKDVTLFLFQMTPTQLIWVKKWTWEYEMQFHFITISHDVNDLVEISDHLYRLTAENSHYI